MFISVVLVKLAEGIKTHYFLLIFEMMFSYMTQVGLEFVVIILLQHPQFWDCRHAVP